MGFSIAVAGGIVLTTLLAALAVFSLLLDETGNFGQAISASSDLEDEISKTQIETLNLEVQPKNGTFYFFLNNQGNEKLWDYEKFDLIVTYDANVTGTQTRISTPLTYNSTADVIIQTFTMRPDGDVDAGGWGDSDSGDDNGVMFDEIDEALRDDLDYTNSDDINNGNKNDVLEISLSDAPDPEDSSDHVVFYTYRKDSTGGVTLELTVSLLQGTTTIASWNHPADITTTWTEVSQTLTAIEADSITNYNDLRIEFAVDCVECKGQKKHVQVSWAGMEIPGTAVTGIDINQWAFFGFLNDYLDPGLINSEETGVIAAILEHPVWIGGFFELSTSTDNGQSALITDTA